MSSVGKILDLECLLAADLPSLIPQRGDLTVHVDAFVLLNLDGRTTVYLEGSALEEFRERYREGKANLFIPLSAKLRIQSDRLNVSWVFNCSSFVFLNPPPFSHPLTPFFPLFFSVLAKKTFLSS